MALVHCPHMEGRPADDPDIWEAIRRGKLVVRGEGGHVYYGAEALKKANRTGPPFPGLVLVENMTDGRWAPFAAHYGLEDQE
jgi:hypothetical protein